MRRGQNYYGMMLVCVLVLAVGTIFLLAQAPPSINAALSQSQNRIGDGTMRGIIGAGEANLIVRARTGNVAQGSAMPCCANAAKGGCGASVANCTYASGNGLSCFSKLFDIESGSCA